MGFTQEKKHLISADHKVPERPVRFCIETRRAFLLLKNELMKEEKGGILISEEYTKLPFNTMNNGAAGPPVFSGRIEREMKK